MIDAVKFLMERAAKEPHVVDRYALERAASALEAEMDANTFAHHRYRRAHTCRDCGQAVWHDCEVEVEAEMKGEAACQHPRTRRHMQPAATDDRTCLDCGLMLTTPAKPELSETKCPHCAGLGNWECCNCSASCGPDCPKKKAKPEPVDEIRIGGCHCGADLIHRIATTQGKPGGVIAPIDNPRSIGSVQTGFEPSLQQKPEPVAQDDPRWVAVNRLRVSADTAFGQTGHKTVRVPVADIHATLAILLKLKAATPDTVPRAEYEALRDAATEASDHLHESYARGTDRGCRGNTPCPVEARLDVALRHADEVLGRKP